MDPSSASLARKTTNGQAGFTLLEMLVSALILSAMSFAAFFSMGLFLNEWEHRRMGDIRAIADFRTHDLIRRSLEGIWEYYVTDPLSERENTWYPYFQANSRRFAFVTASPVFEDHGAAAAEIVFIPPEYGASGGRLVYRETPLDRVFIHYADDEPSYTRSLTWIDRIQEIRIRYFGVLELIWNEEIMNFMEIRGWTDSFSGHDRHLYPETIEIKVKDLKDAEQLFTFYVRSQNRSKAGLLPRD